MNEKLYVIIHMFVNSTKINRDINVHRENFCNRSGNNYKLRDLINIITLFITLVD